MQVKTGTGITLKSMCSQVTSWLNHLNLCFRGLNFLMRPLQHILEICLTGLPRRQESQEVTALWDYCHLAFNCLSKQLSQNSKTFIIFKIIPQRTGLLCCFFFASFCPVVEQIHINCWCHFWTDLLVAYASWSSSKQEVKEFSVYFQHLCLDNQISCQV